MAEKHTCPHMSGDELCTICRELIAYRVCFEGCVEAMGEHPSLVIREAARLLKATFAMVHKVCMEGKVDVEEIERTFESIARRGESDDGSGTAPDQSGQ